MVLKNTFDVQSSALPDTKKLIESVKDKINEALNLTEFYQGSSAIEFNEFLDQLLVDLERDGYLDHEIKNFAVAEYFDEFDQKTALDIVAEVIQETHLALIDYARSIPLGKCDDMALSAYADNMQQTFSALEEFGCPISDEIAGILPDRIKLARTKQNLSALAKEELVLEP